MQMDWQCNWREGGAKRENTGGGFSGEAVLNP